MGRNLHLLVCLLIICLIPFPAWGEEEESTDGRFLLPEGIEEIGDGAFSGNPVYTHLALPASLRTLGREAFMDCPGLMYADIPGSVAEIGDDCFSGCMEEMLIRTDEKGAAYAYAAAHQVDVQVQGETQYRALLIGQTYNTVSGLRLFGPETDLVHMTSMLESFEGTAYEVNVRKNLTREGILSQIAEVFSEAGEEDVSLLYYSGHGIDSDIQEERGSLLGADNMGYVTPRELREALDQIPGRKIVIIDACFSGNMLLSASRSSGPQSRAESAERMTNAIIQAFSRRTRSGLASGGYFVLTACAEDEECFEDVVAGKVMGLFTHALVVGARGAADSNGSGSLSLQELYSYTTETVDGPQHVQVYPSSCSWFGIFRNRLPDCLLPSEPSESSEPAESSESLTEEE